MKRANPDDLRRALQLAHNMVQAGVLFVPVPVLDREEFGELSRHAAEKLTNGIKAAELEAQLEAVGAGGVGPLMAPASHPEIPDSSGHCEQDLNMVRQAKQKASDRVIAVARALLTWIECEHLPPVRDKIETGRMVRVRLHALADLHDAVKELEAA